jgi:hypothetical protein
MHPGAEIASLTETDSRAGVALDQWPIVLWSWM